MPIFGRMSDDPFALDDEPASPPAAAHQPWLEGLNPEQRAAVEATEGPLLVLSGAGTGKTRVLTTRLAHILMSGRARPYECLAVTFTNKAAREMRERVATVVGPVAEAVWLGTFHALGARILRRHADLAGLTGNFTILDTDDQLRLLKQVMEAEGVDSRKWTAQSLLGAIQRWKDRGLTPDKVTDDANADLAGGRAVALYALYQRRLRELNACDFGDLLLHNLTIFADPAHRDVLERYQQRFRYLLVDEYQDTNVAQYLWLRLLARGHGNICCVGDDDQSIYSWRGAEVGNILRFEADFPGARIIRLERNYRSTPRILAAASGLIANNAGRLGKTLRPGPGGDEGEGERLVVRGAWDGEEEARLVVEEIEARQRDGVPLARMAVLVRAGFQTREFEERLITCGVPYRIIGGLRFYERREIRDALAYFRVVCQPADDLAFERIVNLPKRGLGQATMQSLHIAARGMGVPLLEAARRLADTDEIKPKPRATLAALLGEFDRWRGLLDGQPHPQVARTILEESGYADMWRRDRSPEAPGRLDNLKELAQALEEYESLPAFLEHVSLVMENDQAPDGDKVNLMTLHGAKGLEFDVVFLPGWEEGVFPNQRALDGGGLDALEEERRLAYVGLTRARRRVFVSHVANRRVYNQWQSSIPSRFLDELPEHTVERQALPGLYAERGGLGEGGGAWDGDWPARPMRPVPLSEAAPARTAPRPESDAAYAVGERVFHRKFGYGTVRAVDANKLEIAFDRGGVRKVIDSFIQPA